MTEEENHKDSFLATGITSGSSESDKNLFRELQEIIYDHLTRGGHDYKPEPMEYRASSIGTCSRKIILEKDLNSHLDENEYKELPDWYRKELETKEKVIEFGAHITGQMIHEVIQEALADRIIAMEEEVSKQYGRAKIVGHYDLLLENEDGEKIVIDIKSTQSSRPYLPNQKHLMQLLGYQGMLGGINGALLYVNRNNFELSYVSQEFDKGKFSKIIQKLTSLAYHEENKKLPPAVPEFNYECHTEYFTCQFYKFCYGGPPEKIEPQS